jgi:peptide-methionine (S)-S-oxide reductase
MNRHRTILAAAVVLATSVLWLRGAFVGIVPGEGVPARADTPPWLETAIFAGGCFWCVEADFDAVPGVVATTSGYTGGHIASPTYEQVSAGATRHAEAVEVLFDPAVVSYEALLERFWHSVDPFVAHRQFCDVGEQYRPEVFVATGAQRAAAEASKARLQESVSETIVVQITHAGPFYPAEARHQDYHTRHAVQYRFYRWTCGRDVRLAEIWGDT